MSDGAEQKPKASTLDRKVYWAKRDELEREIARVEKNLAVTTTGGATEYIPGWREENATLRERLTALGEPPGPRVREGDASDERRDRFIAAALTGLLADPNQVGEYETFAAEAIAFADAVLVADEERS